jgi:hypothetical protein
MTEWSCEAYGPDGAEVGALCFVAEPGQRACADASECARTMAPERQRLFGRMQEMAAAGDETGVYLAGEFTSPDQLLGGAGDGHGASFRSPG